MRPLVFLGIYIVLALATVPLFVHIEYVKKIQKDASVLMEPDAHKSKAARAESFVNGVLYALVWPVALVGTLVWVTVNGFSFGVPKEMKREVDLRAARKIIEDYEKEQYDK